MDPITLEILWNRLIAVVNEQAAALMRTSFTSIVRESGDLSAGIFDRRGNMIAQAVTGTPGHINSMATCIHHFLAVYPVEVLRPGDILITNDPWMTSGQLHDLTIITPIFHRDRVVAFFGNTCHALDIGGRGLGADAREVYEEGLYIPVTKLYAGGQPNEELFKIIRANVRTPDEVMGDIHAQVVANDVGGRNLLEFLEEFDLADIEDLSDAIIERSEAAMRAAIASIPPGVYPAVGEADGWDEPIRLQVAVTVTGDGMLVDFTGSSPQSPRGINVVLNYTHAYATYAAKCALAPDVPNNEGSFRPLRVAAPPGCILNAQKPVAVAGRHIIGHFLPGLIFTALAPAIPDRVMAEGAANIWNTQVMGHDPKKGRAFAYVYFSGGGTGARPTKDGLNCTAFPSGIAGVPAEVIESLSPVLMVKREIRADSGGPGRFRGGCGQTMVLRVRTDRPFTLSTMYDRITFPARGLLGGGEGACGEIFFDGGRPLHSKSQQVLPAEAVITLRLPGGGGYGPPGEREAERVVRDVCDGYVSRERAREDYGVVLEPATLEVDAAATAARRTAIRQAAARAGERSAGGGKREGTP